MQGGFLSGGNKPKPKQQQQPKIEDVTHVKAKPKTEQFKIEEVQEAMKLKQGLMDNKNEWMNAEFMAKLAKSPKLF